MSVYAVVSTPFDAPKRRLRRECGLTVHYAVESVHTSMSEAEAELVRRFRAEPNRTFGARKFR